jgi:hypothetical protein
MLLLLDRASHVVSVFILNGNRPKRPGHDD